jgi:hypothetical protein
VNSWASFFRRFNDASLVIFAFVVRNFRWLARVPLLPQLFDTMLLLGTALFDWRALGLRESLEREASRSLGVVLGVHRFGGVGFILGGNELAHLHGNGLFDAFVGINARNRVVDSGMALPHHVFPRSGWVSFWIRTNADLPKALELMRIAQRYRTSLEVAAA